MNEPPADSPGSTGIPASIAAIMASIRAEVAAPRRDLDDDRGREDASAAVDRPDRAAAASPPREATVPPAAAPQAAIDAEARALLAPMLRDWLDAHLPEIVETAVHAEIRRLTGLGVDNPAASA